MSWNLPDDYGNGWQYCREHNIRWHLSDRFCDKCMEASWEEEEQEPYKVGEVVYPYHCLYLVGNHVAQSQTYKKGGVVVREPGTYGIHITRDNKISFTKIPLDRVYVNTFQAVVNIPE